VSFEESYARLLGVVERIVKALKQDYVASREAGIVSEREEVYRAYYRVHPIPIGYQSRPVIFVDAGFHVLETDVLSLVVTSVGGCVRDEDGRLHYPSELGDYEFPETLFLYGRWVERAGQPEFTIKLIPVNAAGLLYNEERSEKVSTELTNLINKRIKTTVSRVKLLRLFRKMVKYLEGLLEIAYSLRLQDLLGFDTVAIVDGTLSRWFSVKTGIKFFDFDGIDILEVLVGKSRETIIQRLMRTYGIVKNAKFTSIARARWLFKVLPSNPLGLYANTDAESAEKAVAIVNSKIREKYGEEAGEEAALMFNRVVHPRAKLWSAKFPITTEGNTVVYLEAHTEGPVLGYERGRGAYAQVSIAEELKKRISSAVEDVMAHRSSIFWYPPYGFMELDQYVRIPMSRLRKLEDVFINVIRRETGEVGHPLEYLFESTRRMRIGYAG